MEVVIEQVLLDNFIIDYLILNFTNKILKLKVNKKNIILGSIVGCLFALALPLLDVRGLFLYLIKILIGFCMVLILKKYKNLRELIVSTITMVSITFLFGGLCSAITCEFDIMQTFMICDIEFSAQIVLGLIVVYAWLFNKVLNYIKSKGKHTNFSYDIEIEVDGKIFKLKGYLDSGNRLYDLDKKPIMLLSKSAFHSINKEFSEFGNILKNMHFVEMQTAIGNDSILVFEIDKLIVKKEDKENFINECVRVGIANTDFKNFDCLLSLDMVN